MSRRRFGYVDNILSTGVTVKNWTNPRQFRTDQLLFPQVLIEYDGSEDSWMCFGSNQVHSQVLTILLSEVSL